jgi:endonuclease/exonuclease/phosphatase family metal-dependent hydrolase
MKKSSLLVLIVLVFVGFAEAQIPKTANLRIMTYNIWNGFDWGKDSIRRENTIEWIKSQKPDVLGDFNSLSPLDAYWMEKNTALKNRILQNKNEKYSNLRMGEFDYSVISEFLACPAVDLCLSRIELHEAYTFPTPVLIGKFNHTSQTIIENRERIDYILASPALEKTCKKVEIFNQEETHMLSDHYPMMAEFKIIL